MGDEFYTGIQPLDREMASGLPPGRLLMLKARPDTQSELLLQTFMNNKDSVYITTNRTEEAVKNGLEDSPFLSNLPHIIELSPDSPLDDIKQKVHSLPEDCYVIIDSIDTLEELDSNRYQNFLNELQEHMIETESIAVLHAYKYLDGRMPPKNRQITEGISDIVFNLEFIEDSGDIETKLIVSKLRGGKALDEAIKVKLTSTVQVDTSRDI